MAWSSLQINPSGQITVPSSFGGQNIDVILRTDKGGELTYLEGRSKKGDYSAHPTNLANMDVDTFHAALGNIFKTCAALLTDPGYLAIIIGPTHKPTGIIDHALCILPTLASNGGLHYENRFIVPYTTQQITGAEITSAREHKRTLKIHRDLIVFRKDADV